MNIHWFPGHMTKSLRMIQDNIKLVDAVVYILDARAPLSCINPALDGIVKNKPIVYVLNKADLVEPSFVKKFCERFKNEGKSVVALNSTVSKSAALVSSEVKRLCGEKITRGEARGLKITVRAMVIGVPNGGKSTFINNLSGFAKTVTGNKAGVTRGKQWIRVDEYFEVLDTPGTLYPKLEDQGTAARLAFIGSISDDVLDSVELALLLIGTLDEMDPGIISSRYKIGEAVEEREWDAESRLSGIAKSRGFIKKGGVFDVEKAALGLIDDFRKGRLGKIALEDL
ncbi:MAG: ribosome biogenesis GTPase YlqF [Firmicutes bacterium]|nr:ribosome biogenesis GTPase YlqF [Bacillota bacterium]